MFYVKVPIGNRIIIKGGAYETDAPLFNKNRDQTDEKI
jgi:hypothetical protein